MTDECPSGAHLLQHPNATYDAVLEILARDYGLTPDELQKRYKKLKRSCEEAKQFSVNVLGNMH